MHVNSCLCSVLTALRSAMVRNGPILLNPDTHAGLAHYYIPNTMLLNVVAVFGSLSLYVCKCIYM